MGFPKDTEDVALPLQIAELLVMKWIYKVLFQFSLKSTS